MAFTIEKSVEILEKTPSILKSILTGISENWVRCNEGENTWSPYDIVGHLIHGEKTDWLVRINIILHSTDDNSFEPYDRFAQLKEDQNIPINILLSEFENLRMKNLIDLKNLNITENDLNRTGIHPELGKVSLQHLISAWVVHDLGHIAQILRVMAHDYEEDVGPWKKYLGILNK